MFEKNSAMLSVSIKNGVVIVADPVVQIISTHGEDLSEAEEEAFYEHLRRYGLER